MMAKIFTILIFSTIVCSTFSFSLIDSTAASDLKNQDINYVKCGVSIKNSSSLSHEFDFERGTWPWMVALLGQKTKKLFCGGVLVSKNKILTAAHCIQNKDQPNRNQPRDILLIFGVHDLNDPFQSGVTLSSPLEIWIHPDWNPWVRNYDADIAVMILDDPIQITKYITPICLWESEEDLEEDSGYVVGWGQSVDITKSHESIPKQLKIPIKPNEECYKENEEFVHMSSNRTLCAGSRNDGQSPCRADSGNGLYVKYNDVFYLKGIMSISPLNPGSCNITNYSLYTNVNKFIKWIMNPMGESYYLNRNIDVKPTDIDKFIKSPTLGAMELVNYLLPPKDDEEKQKRIDETDSDSAENIEIDTIEESSESVSVEEDNVDSTEQQSDSDSAEKVMIGITEKPSDPISVETVETTTTSEESSESDSDEKEIDTTEKPSSSESVENVEIDTTEESTDSDSIENLDITPTEKSSDSISVEIVDTTSTEEPSDSDSDEKIEDNSTEKSSVSVSIEKVDTISSEVTSDRKASTCGIMNEPASLVANGREASKEIWPWSAAIFLLQFPQKKFEYWSAGTLITDKHVVTTGTTIAYLNDNHKYILAALKRFKIYLGVIALDETSAINALKSVVPVKLFLHPSIKDGFPRIANIGIIELSSSVQFTEFISPACLPDNIFEADNFIGQNAFGVGWGYDATGKFTKSKKHALMPIKSQDFCYSYYEKELINSTDSKYFCAGGNGKDTACFGDEPLYFKINDRWQLIGFISLAATFSNEACDITEHILYEDIGKYSAWIKKKIPNSKFQV